MSTTAIERPADEPAARVAINRVAVGDHDFTIERPSARKASSAFRLLRQVSGTVKSVTKALGEFEREYQASHVLELDRVQARIRYPARPLLDDDSAPLLEPTYLGEGDDRVPNPRAGELITVPSVLDGLTEDDWQASGNVVRLPQAPSLPERVGAVFELAVEQAEEELYRLLALFTLTNEEVTRHRKGGSLDQELEARADDLLDDGDLAEVMELAVVIGEVVDDQFRAKAAQIGAERLGKALRLLGIDLEEWTRNRQEAPQTEAETPQTSDNGTSPDESSSSSSTPTSSTDSDGSTDGAPTPSSTPLTTSSSPSDGDSTSSESSEK